MNNNSKFLVALLNNISQHQWFFLIWAIVALFFVKLIVNYQQKANQRNFRREDLTASKGKALTPVSTEKSLSERKDNKD
ncbi:MAG: hypothetical protein EB078_08320 [Proteobacteria bacterium]|nr:hypothetical protein [Pseudomonadota bacterium]NDC25032.1 hypothetical protein [Pseudomonadota bacterium]NDD04896.1 hypothetical protein [Pseudomonadota bacterium]NDG27364.1 hypothetical protein [Pseudomonadota bacterium]